MKNFDLTTKTKRKQLDARHPHYPARIHKGLTLLLRKPETGAETWSVRARAHGDYKAKPLGAVTDAFATH